MANAPIEQPIELQTDSADVRAAASVVRGLQDEIKALGPAAAAAGSQASAAMRALSAASAAAQKDVAAARAVQAVRDARRNTPAGSAEEAKARARAEQAAASAARKSLDESTKKAEKGQAALAKAGDELIGKAALAISAMIAAATAAIAAMSAKFFQALVSVQAFREGTVNAFAKILGSTGAADAALKATIKTADEIGIGYREALSSVNALLAQGFKVDKAQELVKAMADLRSVNPAANIEAIVRSIGKIQATGHLQGDELNELNEAGLSAKLVYEALAKQLGKTVEEVQKMQKAGKLGSEDVIKAILSGVQATTKLPIGQAAAQAANSLQGLMARVQQLPEALLLSANASKGMGAVKDVLKNVLAAFGPASAGGKALAAVLGKLGDAFAKAFSGLTGSQGKAALESFGKGLVTVLDRVAGVVASIASVVGPALGGLVKGLGDGMAAGDKLFGSFEKGAGTADKIGPAIVKIATAAGFLAGALIAVIGVFEQMSLKIGQVSDFLASFDGNFTSIIQGIASNVLAAAMSIGGNLIAGIVAGINLAMPGLLAVVNAVAAATTGASKQAYGTHSPSVIWRDEIGYQLPAGEAQGIEKGAPLVNRAIMRTAKSATATAAGAGGGGLLARLGAAGGGPLLVIENLYARTADDARAIADVVEERMRLMLGEVANG